MTDWRTALHEVAASDEDERLSPDDALAMRRVVVAAVVAPRKERPIVPWIAPLALAATVVLMIAVGIVGGRRIDQALPAGDASSNAARIEGTAAADAAGPGGGSQRQLQFLTPGGTRIIWVFNSDLELKATLR